MIQWWNIIVEPSILYFCAIDRVYEIKAIKFNLLTFIAMSVIQVFNLFQRAEGAGRSGLIKY